MKARAVRHNFNFDRALKALDEEDFRDLARAFVHPATGEIRWLHNDGIQAAQQGTTPMTYADQLGVEVETANEVPATECTGLLRLPTERVDDFEIMRGFCPTESDEDVRNELFAAIDGRGAISRFRGVVARWKLEPAFERHREKALREILAEWASEQTQLSMQSSRR